MKTPEINQKNEAELAGMLQDSRKQLAQLMIDQRTKQSADIKQMRVTKKTIARILTLQRARQLQSQASASAAETTKPATEAVDQAPEKQEKTNG